MSVELTIETVEETIVLELQDHVPPVLTIDHIPDLRDELDSKVDKAAGLGLSQLSFTTADKSSLDQSEQDRHTHSNKTVIDKLSDDDGVLQYKGLPIGGGGGGGSDPNKVDKVPGKSLVSDTEIAKLATVQENATANRPDIENADKIHGHTTGQVAGLDAELLAKFDKANIVQTTGTATDKVMSQKAVSDLITASNYIPTPTPTPAAFGDPFEGGFYTGMIWNHIALSTDVKALAIGSVTFNTGKATAICYIGQSLEVRSIANPANKFIGTVKYAAVGSITLDVTSIGGTGTFSDWAIMSRFRVITAPKAQGESAPIAMKFENTAMPVATQTANEGWLSTNAMVAAGTALQYPAAHWARSLVINGFDDWYIPARDELELNWRNLKPVTSNNYTGARPKAEGGVDLKRNGVYADVSFTQGTNLNSSPQGLAYTLTDPAQTTASAFQSGGAEEFAFGYIYWTSTDVSPVNVMVQMWRLSDAGAQWINSRTAALIVRAVRRSII